MRFLDVFGGFYIQDNLDRIRYRGIVAARFFLIMSHIGIVGLLEQRR